jgi:hypothetical protein
MDSMAAWCYEYAVYSHVTYSRYRGVKICRYRNEGRRINQSRSKR